MVLSCFAGNLLAMQSALLGSPTSTFNLFPGGMADLHATFGIDPQQQMMAMATMGTNTVSKSCRHIHTLECFGTNAQEN